VLASGLDWMSVRHSNILSEHKVSLGARTAAQRILHFLLELWVRLEQVGLANGKGFELELTQEQIGDCMGLSTVHVNRSLSRLSKENLVRLDKGTVTFPQVSRSVSFADFDDRFLMEFETRKKEWQSESTFTPPEPQLHLCNGPQPRRLVMPHACSASPRPELFQCCS
jgi:CRP/FNR family transcriptional regulator